MTANELKEIYPKLRKADKYLIVAFHEDVQEASCSMDITYDQCDMLVTWLIDQMDSMDKMQ